MAFDPISAAFSVGGKLLDYFSAQDANATSREDAMNAELRQAERTRLAQENSIQMRVKDANLAGVHPLYALGAPVMSGSPSIVGSSATPSLGPVMRELGQNISGKGGIGAQEAPTGYQAEAMALDLESRKLQNEILRNKAVQGRQALQPPAPGTVFPVPENPKIEQRPPLMFGGRRWDTNPDTSPMKAWEDQYGDEGPVAATFPLMILANDLEKQYGPVQSWPGHVLRWGIHKMSEDFMNEMGNLKRTFPNFNPGKYR